MFVCLFFNDVRCWLIGWLLIGFYYLIGSLICWLLVDCWLVGGGWLSLGWFVNFLVDSWLVVGDWSLLACFLAWALNTGSCTC